MTRTLILIILLVSQSCRSQDNSFFENQESLMAIVFSDNSSSRQSISLKKATHDESMDTRGWIDRIENNQFGFPEFNEDVGGKVSEYRDSLNTLKQENYLKREVRDSLYAIKTRSIVDEFFLEDDKSFLKNQIISAKPGKWNPNKYNVPFSVYENAMKFSQPYFNKANDKAVIFQTSPNLEQAQFYKKINGHWKFYFSSYWSLAIPINQKKLYSVTRLLGIELKLYKMNKKVQTLVVKVAKIGVILLWFIPASCTAQNDNDEEIYEVPKAVLQEFQGLEFVLCYKPLEYNANSITTKGKPLIEALDIDLIANFQEWTPIGDAVPIKDILNYEDLNYMKSQITSGFEWEKEKLPAKVKSCQNNYRSDTELKISKPLFNKEKNISLVFLEKASIADYSNSLILLKKKNDNWKIEWSLNM